jgi:FkbM family methyltransferase
MKSCIHIGIADWCEIAIDHGKKYDKVIGIEAIYSSYYQACIRAEMWNKHYGTSFQALNYLVMNEDDKEFEFNIASNNGHSSSVYPMKEHKEIWKEVKEIEKVKLKSKRMMTIIKENNIPLLEYEVLIVDVQGAELEVLKSFDGNIKHFKMIEVEISQRELYEGQVLYEELNQYLESLGFKRKCEPHTFHCNLQYEPI